MAMEVASSRGRVYPVSAGQYKLFEEIGCSPSSTVYRALCLLFNEVVAIKTLDLESSCVNLDDIRREAQSMRLSNHVNLVKAHCSFMVDRSVWVVMPYLSGGSCLHIIKAAFQEGFQEPVIATILKESLKALEYLHRQGLIHRDVKAGNILLDGDGSVKLGDFGVSASMFETGDRQRSRTTFVGTPCWMAPEVIEKLHGYDFKADIWSFGITALELAHGHAPFSKYPPMKVLLMTLQNNPPGLDYERDKRFSRSFKEMIAMCLVKEPTKRPSAERLLRHSFFRGARSADYTYRHVLEGLPPLGERVKQLRLLDNARLAQKKMPLSEQEQKSQSEYQKGVSGWNFNVEDLKAQAALIADDDDHGEAEDDHQQQQQQQQQGYKGFPDQIHHSMNSIHDHASLQSHDTGQLQPPVTLHILKVESTANEGGERITRVRSGPLPAPGSHSKPTNGQRPIVSKKEPKHIGRFDVFEDDIDVEEQGTRRPNDKERSREDFYHRDHRRQDLERERDKEHRQCGRVASSERLVLDQRPTNGLQASMRASSVNKEGAEEKSKTAQKTPVVQRGRFSVTSDDVSIEDPPHGRRRTPSSEGLQQQQGGVAANASNSPTVPVVAVIPHLQNALNHAVMQQEALYHVLNSITPSEASSQSRILRHSRSSNSNMGSHHSSMGEIASERERDLIQQIADLQSKTAVLADELHALKHKNVLLERQLNAHYNREMEERIRQEEAHANDDI